MTEFIDVKDLDVNDVDYHYDQYGNAVRGGGPTYEHLYHEDGSVDYAACYGGGGEEKSSKNDGFFGDMFIPILACASAGFFIYLVSLEYNNDSLDSDVYQAGLVPQVEQVQRRPQSDLEVITKDLNGDGKPETMIRVGNVDYLIKEIGGKPTLIEL